MDIYQLEYILHEPTEDQGWMYWAEIPAIQGCAAWGDTVEDTIRDLWGNAKNYHRNDEGGRQTPASGAGPKQGNKRDDHRHCMTYRGLTQQVGSPGVLLPQTGARLPRAVAKPKQWQDCQHSKTRQSGPEDRNAPQNSQRPGNIEGRLRRGLSRQNFMREPGVP